MPNLVPRSREMVIVAYFLARWGEPTARGATVPPKELGADSWKRAYSVFYTRLSEGRSVRTFRNSLQTARAVYDAHLPSGRKGWKRAGADRPPAKLPSRHQSVWDDWASKPRAELWDRIQQFADLGVSKISGRVLDDLDVQLGESEEPPSHTEGGKKVFVSSRAERDPTVRAAAIRIHGTSCAVCRLDFGRAYGEWGAGYVEVHHLVPLGDKLGTRETDPTMDLAVLCANCHRMVHRKTNMVLTIEELRSKLNFRELLKWARSLADGALS